QSSGAGKPAIRRARGDHRGAPAPRGGACGRMCGIVGIVHRDAERPVDPAALRTMCDAIRHRGPDDEGTLVSGPVGLGMRRLSIIDLAGGRQPMTNEDGSQVIVFNGEIYNYRELRRELVRRRHRFRTHSDTGAVMVHPYWDLPRHETPAPPDIADRLVEWLDDSVAAHLVSDVPVAAFLSGGLDSSAVVASMAVAGEGPPHAFTARYFGSGAADTDETELARQLARRYDARLTIVDIRPNLRESFEPIVRALDEPHADDSAVPTWALSQ